MHGRSRDIMQYVKPSHLARIGRHQNTTQNVQCHNKLSDCAGPVAILPRGIPRVYRHLYHQLVLIHSLSFRWCTRIIYMFKTLHIKSQFNFWKLEHIIPLSLSAIIYSIDCLSPTKTNKVSPYYSYQKTSRQKILKNGFV